MNVRFHRLAVAEIDHEVDYYESRQVGLGDELEDEIDAVLTTIRRFSEAAPPTPRLLDPPSLGSRHAASRQELAGHVSDSLRGREARA